MSKVPCNKCGAKTLSSELILCKDCFAALCQNCLSPHAIQTGHRQTGPSRPRPSTPTIPRKTGPKLPVKKASDDEELGSLADA